MQRRFVSLVNVLVLARSTLSAFRRLGHAGPSPTKAVLAAGLAFIALACASPAAAQAVGECVLLKATKPAGVPVHERAANSFTGQRLPDGSIATVLEVDATGRWFRLSGAQNITGWVVKDYIGAVVPCDSGGAASLATETTAASYRVAAWNLEHLHTGMARGFPEYVGAEALPPRTSAEYQNIASIIKTLNLKVVILEEINGEERTDPNGETIQRSVEMDELLGFLGNQYAYEIASSGDAQRIALLWDTSAAFLNWSCEADFPNVKVNGKGLFDREPLLGYFTFFANGQEMNDLVVIGVHLASGQDLTSNHDKAMEAIQGWISDNRAQNLCIPSGEHDVLIGGDFNANRFDSRIEHFWDTMEAGPYDVLADPGSGYKATRLSGKPPTQGNSVIDYLIASDDPGGLMGNEVSMATAHIHDDLVASAGGGLAFRKKASDHLPVSVEIRVVPDSD